MGNKDNQKVIYRIVHKESGKSYVGSTTRNLKTRLKEHIKDAENNSPYPIHQAIATYGTEAFKYEQIDTASSIDELAAMEKNYIVKYNTQDNGYNVDSGGGFMKTVYQYDISTGRLLNTFSCLEEAAETINCGKQSISRACLKSTNTYRGFYWSYNYDEPFCPGKDRRLKEVVQIDQFNNWVATYKSVSEASRKTGIYKSCIAKVCRGERRQTNGFIFRYAGEIWN